MKRYEDDFLFEIENICGSPLTDWILGRLIGGNSLDKTLDMIQSELSLQGETPS